ncbi:hypothetical protein LZ31DRAFT_589714 [Colletotrichum somersetense]|nr:hypothetical protein LZ31DRAFT_589714 [Colletotrichum somersetense]
MEYIEGTSIESMCDRKIVDDSDDSDADGDDGASSMSDSGRLLIVPNKTAFVRFPSSRDGKPGVSFGDLSASMRVFRTLLDGCVVFLDYTYSVIWSDTLSRKIGRADEYDSLFPKVPSSYLLDVHPLERLPRPPHPAWKYGDIGYLDGFSGWIPPEWMRCPRRCEGCPTGRENLCKKPFRDWLIQEFGAVNDRSGRYSSHYDLEQVLRKAAATEREGKVE